jgi:hypothetical protein
VLKFICTEKVGSINPSWPVRPSLVQVLAQVARQRRRPWPAVSCLLGQAGRRAAVRPPGQWGPSGARPSEPESCLAGGEEAIGIPARAILTGRPSEVRTRARQTPEAVKSVSSRRHVHSTISGNFYIVLSATNLSQNIHFRKFDSSMRHEPTKCGFPPNKTSASRPREDADFALSMYHVEGAIL